MIEHSEGRAQAVREFDLTITDHRGDRTNAPVLLEAEGTDILYRLQRTREAGFRSVPEEIRVRNGKVRVFDDDIVSPAYLEKETRKRHLRIVPLYHGTRRHRNVFAEQWEKLGDGQIITDAFEPIRSLAYARL